MVSRHDAEGHVVSRRVLRGFRPDLLADRRETSGLSISELARLAEIGKTTLRQWEEGAVSPQVDLLARTMQVLDGTIGDVVVVPEGERYPGDLRILRGLLQPTLGLRAGVSTSTVALVERGQIGLTDSTATKLAAALDLPVEEYRTAYERVRHRPRDSAV